MSQQAPPARGFPHTPSVPQKRHEHDPADMQDYRGNALQQQPALAAQEEHGRWDPLANIWAAFAGTEETQQDPRDRIQRERAEQERLQQQQQRQQQLQQSNYHHRSQLDGILRQELHHELDDLPSPSRAYPQARHQLPAQKDGFYEPKQRGASEARSRSPPARFRQSPLRAPESPGPPLPSENSIKEERGLWHFFCGTERRRLNFWTVLSILMLGPPIFLGGFYAGHGLESNPRVWMTPHDGNGGIDNSTTDGGPVSSPFRPTLPPHVYDTNIFMAQDEVLEEDELLFLASTNQGIHLKQESNGNLVLYDLDKTVLWHSGLIRATWTSRTYSTVLRGDGNLVTRSTTYNSEDRSWSTEVEWSSQSEASVRGEYRLMLTPNADGLMIIRLLDDQIIWSTIPVDLETSPTSYPTRSPKHIFPTRPPVFRTPTAQPTDFPTVAPSPRPTMFPWPVTVPQSQAYSIESGPMVGHTTHDSVMFWTFLGRPVPLQLMYWPYTDDGVSSSQTLTLVPDTEFNGAAMGTLRGLQADTSYLYEIRIDDEWLSRGQFKTSPVPKQPTFFKYLLASCMNVKSNDGGYEKQPVWNAAMAKNVDFAMLPGDTVYLDNNDWTAEGEMMYDRIWYRNMQQRAESHFAHLIKTVPTYGQWDDHDYGKNNAEHRQKGKENSLRAWGHLWPQPYQGSSYGTGNYYSYSWGDVDFFVLDCRWYRNSNNGTLFGEPQLKWLTEGLVASTATFKIIVSASDVMEKSMSRDLKTIGRTVSEHSISGVLFNSGDIHRNEYKVQDIENWPYRVHQLTSSGIARVWRRPFAIINVDTGSSDPFVRADFYSADSRDHDTTWSNDPGSDCSEIDGENRNKESRCTQRLRLSDLTPP